MVVEFKFILFKISTINFCLVFDFGLNFFKYFFLYKIKLLNLVLRFKLSKNLENTLSNKMALVKFL